MSLVKSYIEGYQVLFDIFKVCPISQVPWNDLYDYDVEGCTVSTVGQWKVQTTPHCSVFRIDFFKTTLLEVDGRFQHASDLRTDKVDTDFTLHLRSSIDEEKDDDQARLTQIRDLFKTTQPETISVVMNDKFKGVKSKETYKEAFHNILNENASKNLTRQLPENPHISRRKRQE